METSNNVLRLMWTSNNELQFVDATEHVRIDVGFRCVLIDGGVGRVGATRGTMVLPNNLLLLLMTTMMIFRYWRGKHSLYWQSQEVIILKYYFVDIY